MSHPNSKSRRLAARVEEVCLNAWPALQEIHYDGWLIRLADGQTRRTNSVNVINARVATARREDRLLRGRLPAARSARAIFDCCRPPTARWRRRWRRAGIARRTRRARCSWISRSTSLRARRGLRSNSSPHAPSAEWLSARMRFQGGPARANVPRSKRSCSSLAIPAVFAAVRDEDGTIASIAKGAVHDGIVCLNMVASDPAQLRRGYSRACVSAILDWASRRRWVPRGHAFRSCRTTRRRSGCMKAWDSRHELYRYHYRTRAARLRNMFLFCSTRSASLPRWARTSSATARGRPARTNSRRILRA